MSKRIVTVFGGSGFLGRHVISKLARQDTLIRVAVRRPEFAGFLCPMGAVGQVSLMQANVRDDGSVARAVEGADEVVNLAGILSETGRQKFSEVHGTAPGRIARAASEAGVKRLIHVSAIGAKPEAISAYARSKAAGETALRDAYPAATILRPGVMFGPEDDFFNKFGALARISPVLPLFFPIRQRPKFHMEGLYMVPEIEAGTTRMQPVFVGDVAEALSQTLTAPAPGSAAKTYELGGPNVYSFRELMELIAKETQYKRHLVPVPYFAADMMGFFMQFMPEPMFTADQAKMLRADNVVSEHALKLSDLGISATPAELILPTYMHRFRRARTDSTPHAQT
ncbi:MAG: complex I NDUFA9 subunit family protein [Rhodospirillaceae bacterium]|nr:complex I NDUFA9 subunit family protein [Rhodospirillaceae bacterium]MBT7294577.1 complex I NDUFA9 subunit family protein [Rhodospirillaceae bacterium]